MRAGFTLLEVILALMLITLLSGAIFGFLWNVMDRRDALVQATAEAQSAGALLELLESDLACAVAGDPELGAGVAGEAHRLRVISRRVWAPSRADERTAAMGDLQISEYTFSVGEGVLSVRRWPAEGEGREEASREDEWFGDSQFDDRQGGGAVRQQEPIAERIEALRIRFFDGERWLESFDSLERRELPVAIEIAVWFRRGGSGGARVAGNVGGGVEMNAAGARNAGEGDAYGEYDDWDIQPEVPRRSPDRLRVISIPDGPTTAWRDMR